MNETFYLSSKPADELAYEATDGLIGGFASNIRLVTTSAVSFCWPVLPESSSMDPFKDSESEKVYYCAI